MKKELIIGILIISFILISGFNGCQKVICNKPYIQVGTECCLDNNDNAICDKDESAMNQEAAEQGTVATNQEVMGQKMKGECMIAWVKEASIRKEGKFIRENITISQIIGKACIKDQDCIGFWNSNYPASKIPVNITCEPLSPYKITNIPCSKVMDCADYLFYGADESSSEQIKEGFAEVMKCENKLCVLTEATMNSTGSFSEYKPSDETVGQQTEEKCIIATGSGLFCNKDIVTADSATDKITMNIRNTYTDTVIIESITVGTLCTDSAIDTSIAADTAEDVAIDCTGLTTGIINETLSIQYKVVYSDGGGNFTKTVSGALVKNAS